MPRVNIIQGDLYVGGEVDLVIATLLGSCIAVCLHDAVAKVGGMNHFLLGTPGQHQNVTGTDLQRYGVHAMELLINEMMKKGALRQRLRAHLYGGANIIAGLGAIGGSNALFARRFVETEGIELGRCETGGTAARRVEFMPHLGRVRSWIVAEPVPTIVSQPRQADGDLELF